MQYSTYSSTEKVLMYISSTDYGTESCSIRAVVHTVPGTIQRREHCKTVLLVKYCCIICTCTSRTQYNTNSTVKSSAVQYCTVLRLTILLQNPRWTPTIVVCPVLIPDLVLITAYNIFPRNSIAVKKTYTCTSRVQFNTTQ